MRSQDLITAWDISTWDTTTSSNNDTAPEVSIVLPCLNEATTLESCLRKANLAIATHHLHAEVIVADNGSQDDSKEKADACGAMVIHVQERGYGAALMAGIAMARGKYVIMGDADDSYDFTSIYPFIEKLRAGYDLVMGCRFPHAGGTILPGAMPWLHRYLGNPALSRIGRLFFNSPVTDFHCGMRGFRRQFIHTLDLQATGMEFASEMVIKATLIKARITEIPITLHRDGRNRPPHLRTWRDGWRHLRFMLLYCPRWLFLLPGSLLFLTGMISGTILLTGPITLSGITFDTNTLLVSAMAILTGFNLVTFGIISKSFAISTGFLPPDPVFQRILRRLTLEVGIISGIFITLLGAIILSLGVLYWHSQNFGALSYSHSLRLVIPGTTALTLGIELMFSSFLLSLFRMPHK
ncbi:MAG: dolichol-P-glucose synthetase [Nitrospirales bacterium]|nr:MAG: dolichol-P-glucose synthetase [Nitrospirales bacterium]